MTPEQFAADMREIAKFDADPEGAHSMADDLLCKLLTELGYAEGVKVFEDMDKWYA